MNNFMTNFNNRIPNQFTNFNNQTRTPIFTTPLIRPPINTFLPQTRFNFTNLNRPTPIVRPTLENLRTNTTIELFIENENTDNELCTICRQNFENNDILRTINHCNHHFHLTCIDRWFENHISCPFCRHDIRNQSQNETQNQSQNETQNQSQNENTEYNNNGAVNITPNNTQRQNININENTNTVPLDIDESVSIERVTVPLTNTSLNQILTNFISNTNANSSINENNTN